MRRDYVGLASIFLRLAMAPDTMLESSGERLCQGVSPNDEPCGCSATVHCPRFTHARMPVFVLSMCVAEPPFAST